MSEFISLYIDKEHKDYEKVKYFFISENILYSSQGKWGVMFSDEGYALIGGDSDFMRLIEQIYPEINSQVYNFLDTLLLYKKKFPSTTNIDWLRGLLTHIYGEEEAKKMLKKSGIWRTKKKN